MGHPQLDDLGADLRDLIHRAKTRIHLPQGSPFGGYDDEFDNGSIDASWVHVDQASYENTWYEVSDVKGISVYAPSGKASMQLSGLLKPFSNLSPPFYIETAVRLFGRRAQYPAVGLLFTDGVTLGAGAQVNGSIFINNDSINSQVSRYTNFNNRTNLNELQLMGNMPLEIIYLRFVYESVNNFRLLTSIDGVVWIDMHGLQALTLTPTYFGFVETTHNYSTYPISAQFKYFRVRSGASANG